jgi:hypothetical protein
LREAVQTVPVEHTQHPSHADSHEEHGHGDSEPIIVKRIAMHERLAQEMKKNGIDCSALPLGSHQIEREETYYSHGFALSSRFVTNKGLIEVRGKNIDFVQVLQRN